MKPKRSIADVDPLSNGRAASISSNKTSNDGSLSDRLTDEHDSIPERITWESTAPPPGQTGPRRPLPLPASVDDILGLPKILALAPNHIFEHGIVISAPCPLSKVGSS